MSKINSVVLISGASSGIGAAAAKKFSEENFYVFLLGRDEKKLKAVQSSLKTESDFLAFDLKDFDLHKEKLADKITALGNLDILINNAGIYHHQDFETTPDEIWMSQFQVNLLSAVQLTKMFWPHFKKQNKGSILNISSTLGVKPAPKTSAYSALKAAMVNWTLSLAQEGGAFNIRANCICPGIVDTPIHGFYSLPKEQKNKIVTEMASYGLLKEIGQPEDIAEAAYFLASEKSKWTTGSVLHVDGGINIK